MNHDSIMICAGIFGLLGVRLGWHARVTPLILAPVAALLCACVFVSVDEHFFKFLILAAVFDVALQAGYAVGLFTGTFDPRS